MSAYRELLAEYKTVHDPGDAWGSAMAIFFDLAAELYVRPEAVIPDEWAYRPGAMGGDPREPDSFFAYTFATAETADLERFGTLLHRYTNLLRAAGRSY